MQTVVTELYGIVGMFFTTNVRYELPKASYRDFPSDSSSENYSSESEEEDLDERAAPNPAEIAARAAAATARTARRAAKVERKRRASEKSRAKFREDDYIQRKRELKTQRDNERTVYPMMWKRMSLISQSRVREEEEFQTAYLTLDCVLLWTLIRKTHLTHMVGGHASLEYNQHEQENKYGSMRQGEREHIVTFKNRFDEQVIANLAVGIAPVSDSKRVLDFLGFEPPLGLRPKRFSRPPR